MARSLKALGYQSPEEELGEKFHVSPKLLAALNPGADLEKAGERILVPNVMVMPPGKAGTVVVSKSERAVLAYDGPGKGPGKKWWEGTPINPCPLLAPGR